MLFEESVITYKIQRNHKMGILRQLDNAWRASVWCQLCGKRGIDADESSSGNINTNTAPVLHLSSPKSRGWYCAQRHASIGHPCVFVLLPHIISAKTWWTLHFTFEFWRAQFCVCLLHYLQIARAAWHLGAWSAKICFLPCSQTPSCFSSPCMNIGNGKKREREESAACWDGQQFHWSVRMSENWISLQEGTRATFLHLGFCQRAADLTSSIGCAIMFTVFVFIWHVHESGDAFPSLFFFLLKTATPAEKQIRHCHCIALFREMAPHLHKSDDVWACAPRFECLRAAKMC